MRWIITLLIFAVSCSQVAEGWQNRKSLEVLYEAKKELDTKFYRLHAEVSTDGDIALGTANSIFLDSEVREFDHDVVIDELDLVESQKAQIKKIVKSWHDKIEEVENSFEKRVSNGEGTLDIVKETDAIDEENRNLILDELAPSQVSSFSQISFRYLIRLVGPYRVLEMKAVSNHLEIGENDLKTLRPSMRNERLQFEKQRQEISSLYLEEFLSLLAIDERRRLESDGKAIKCLDDISKLRSFITISLENDEYRKCSAIQRLFANINFEFDCAGGIHIRVPDELDPGLEKGFFLKFVFTNEFGRNLLETLHCRIANAIS